MIMTLRHSISVRMAIASLVVAATVAGCNFQRDSNQPPATDAVQNASTGAPNQPATADTGDAVASPAQATDLPSGVTPTVEATSDTDPLGTEIDQALDELDSLNATADPLDDQP
jgi:hypothetical protein